MLPEIKNILYATDMGPGSSHVFRYALALAQKHEAKVTVLHAVEPLSSFAQSLVELHVSHQNSEQQHAQDRQKLMQELHNRIHEICEKEACLTEENRVSEIQVIEGQPAQTIIKKAAEFGSDLIIMGTHRHSAVGEALLGSTAHKVLHSCSVPTLLIRVPEHEEILAQKD